MKWFIIIYIVLYNFRIILYINFPNYYIFYKSVLLHIFLVSLLSELLHGTVNYHDTQKSIYVCLE
jgi:hypothetical protein